MANIFSYQVLKDDTQTAVIKLTGAFDGTGQESNLARIQANTLYGALATNGFPVVPNSGNANTVGAGWGNPYNGENWINGSLYDGRGVQGPCMINCTNVTGRGIYGFHTNGATVVMGDGSVRFLTGSMNPKNFVYMITARKGEIISE